MSDKNLLEEELVSEEEWTEEDIEEFMRKTKDQQQMYRQQQAQDQPVGVQLTGFVLFCLVIYGAYVGQLMNFTIWVTALMVVLALGNKAIR